MSCITEILKLKGNQEVLLPLNKKGKPWVAVEGGGTYKDYEYLIILNHNGHRCGYVAIPSHHPFSQTKSEMRQFAGGEYEHYDYDSLDLEAHGGLTFMAPDHSLKDLLSTPCTDLWIGFDCGHYFDSCDVEAFKKYYGEEEAKERESFFDCMDGGSVKDFPYVERECHSLIDQLIQKAA